MDKSYIEFRAWELQANIWHEKGRLWKDGAPRPIDMLDPAIAARVLDVRFEFHEELGRFGTGRDRFEVAGMINQRDKLIAVSLRFPPATRRFTGAHEIGHRILHRGNAKVSMHRDRPINDIADMPFHRDSYEQEADHFAACFLIPRRLLAATLKSTFAVTPPLVINDDAAYWLRHDDPDSLFECGPLERAAAVAAARSYGGKLIVPLYTQFSVSIKAMAIRLNELGLVE